MKKIIVTIGRQYGSGGREIALKLAKQFQIPYYDKEILEIAAEKSGLSYEFLKGYDEWPVNRFVYSLAINSHQAFFYGKEILSLEGLARDAQRKAILKAAEESCVIVGRGADDILRNEKGLIRMFISADLADRIKRIMDREAVGMNDAIKMAKHSDEGRASYYRCYTGREWGHIRNYDLCINTSRTGMEQSANLILDYIKRFD